MPVRFRGPVATIGLAIVVFLSMAFPRCPSFTEDLIDSEDASIGYGKHEIDGIRTVTVDITADRRSSSAFLFQNSTYELTPPYVVYFTAGLPDPAHATGFSPGFGGLELSVPGSSPFIFHGLYLQPAPTGSQAFFAYNNGAGAMSGGATFFSDARFLDFRIENDGANLMFGARPLGSGLFQNLGTVPAPVAPFFRPGIGVFNFGDGREVSFFDIGIEEDSEPQGSGYQYVADKYQRNILFPLNEAWNHLNGPDPDRAAASAIVDSLAAGIPGMLVELNALPSGTPEQQKFLDALRKTIEKAHKEVLKAQRAFARGKDAGKAIGKARLAMDQVVGVLRNPDL